MRSIFFSIGSNDYLRGYISNPKTIQPYPNTTQYVNMVVGNLTNTIQELYNIGARKFGFLNVVPILGCYPFMRAMHSEAIGYSWCLEPANELAYEHNGLKEGFKACCGTGPFNGIYSCGGKKNVTAVYQVCNNGDYYVFWDSFHFTDKMHQSVARFLWEGSGEFFDGPYNLQQLFLNNNNNMNHVNAASEA